MHRFGRDIDQLIVADELERLPQKKVAEKATGLYAALFGFWVLLAACPFLVGGNRWWSSVLMFALLGLWDRYYAGAVLRLLGARPLISDPLGAHFTRVIERSRVPALSVWCAGGANSANALALPFFKVSSVLISRTLLDRLSEEETAAIFALEIAHLKHYDRARLRRESLVILGLVSFRPILDRLNASYGWAAGRGENAVHTS